MGVCRERWYDASSVLDGDNDNGERERGMGRRHSGITTHLGVAEQARQELSRVAYLLPYLRQQAQFYQVRAIFGARFIAGVGENKLV